MPTDRSQSVLCASSQSGAGWREGSLLEQSRQLRPSVIRLIFAGNRVINISPPNIEVHVTRPHRLADCVTDCLDASCSRCQSHLSGLPCQEQQQDSNCSSKFTCDGRTTGKNDGCVFNPAYNKRRGAPRIAVDPPNPAHFVGMSVLFFDTFRQTTWGCGCHSKSD